MPGGGQILSEKLQYYLRVVFFFFAQQLGTNNNWQIRFWATYEIGCFSGS